MENKVRSILKVFSEHPVSYFKIYAKITGSVTSGLLLSQIVYWWFKMDEKEFYKTDKDWCDELGLGLWELKTAKNKLLGMVKITRRSIPAKTYYDLDLELLIRKITSYAENQQQVVGKPHNLSEENRITKYTDTTTDTTADTTVSAVCRGIVKGDLGIVEKNEAKKNTESEKQEKHIKQDHLKKSEFEEKKTTKNPYDVPLLNPTDPNDKSKIKYITQEEADERDKFWAEVEAADARETERRKKLGR